MENVPFVLGPGHYNEARHGLMDVARDEPCLTHVTSIWTHASQDDQNRMAETVTCCTVFTSMFTRN